ncbi:hypothetical protein ABZT44_38000, partial [Streptomyces mirabilis]
TARPTRPRRRTDEAEAPRNSAKYTRDTIAGTTDNSPDHKISDRAELRDRSHEDQLEEAQRINAEYRHAAESANPTAPA